MRPIPLLAALAVLAAACSDPAGLGDPTTPGGTTELLVMNALTPGRPATLQLDGEALPLPETGTSLRRAIPGGPHRLEVRGPDGALLGQHEFTLPVGRQRIVVLGQGSGSSVALLGSTSDSAAVIYPRAAKVRLVHAADGVEAADGYLRSNLLTVSDSADRPFVTPFVFGVGSDAMFPRYAVRTPGSYWVAAISRGAPDRVLAEANVTLNPGDVASLVLVRLEGGALGWRLVRE